MDQTTITLRQAAELAGVDPSSFSARKAALPPAVPQRTGANGRPPMAYSLEDLAAFILRRTGHLTDVECRLRVALRGLDSEDKS